MNNEFKVNVLIDGGSSGRIVLTDGKELNKEITITELSPIPPINTFTHTYKLVGLYPICAQVYNTGSKKVSCGQYQVSAPIGVYIFDVPDSNAVLGKTFSLSVQGGASSVLNVIIDWGDGSPTMVTQNYQVTEKIKHMFQKLGVFKVTGRVQQFDDEKLIGRAPSIKVGNGIGNFGCAVTPTVVPPGAPYTLEVTAQSSAEVIVKLFDGIKMIAEESVPSESFSFCK